MPGESLRDSGLSGAERINPYSDATTGKGEQVEQMFNSIAPAYDFMNTAMTFGLHRYWRTSALRKIAPALSGDVLDIATGTGDLVFHIARRYRSRKITGVDLSEGMLSIAEKKLMSLPQEERERIEFRVADCLQLPFEDESFDAITVAYGVRNFEHLRAGYAEMLRVMRSGGRLCVIELATPRNPIVKGLYRVYAGGIIPIAGRIVSGDSAAYSYLPKSIAAAPQRDDMAQIIRDTGFANISWRCLTMGTIAIYTAKKE